MVIYLGIYFMHLNIVLFLNFILSHPKPTEMARTYTGRLGQLAHHYIGTLAKCRAGLTVKGPSDPGPWSLRLIPSIDRHEPESTRMTYTTNSLVCSKPETYTPQVPNYEDVQVVYTGLVSIHGVLAHCFRSVIYRPPNILPAQGTSASVNAFSPI